MREGALKTGRGLKANSVLLIEKVVIKWFPCPEGQIEHCPVRITDTFVGYGK